MTSASTKVGFVAIAALKIRERALGIVQIEMNDAAQEQHVGTAGRQRERMVVAVGRVAMAAEFAQRETARAHRVERAARERDCAIAVGQRRSVVAERALRVAALHVAVGKARGQFEQPVVGYAAFVVPAEFREQARALEQCARVRRIDRERIVEPCECVVRAAEPSEYRRVVRER